jgi:hypothetical protein
MKNKEGLHHHLRFPLYLAHTPYMGNERRGELDVSLILATSPNIYRLERLGGFCSSLGCS